jgi:hypothetical protein
VIFNIAIKTNTSDNLLREKNMGREIIFSAKELFFLDIGTMTIKFKEN